MHKGEGFRIKDYMSSYCMYVLLSRDIYPSGVYIYIIIYMHQLAFSGDNDSNYV